MADREPNFSRMSRKKGKKDKLLNILIGVVILLILIVGITYIAGNGKDEAKDEKQTENAPKEPIVIEDPDEEDAEETPAEKESGEENDSDTGSETDTDESGQIIIETDPDKNDSSNDSITVTPSDDSEIKETVVDADWKPIGTSQTGQHVSKYDGESDDWNEKKQAIAYATGLSEDQLIYWRIQNGGSPQKAEGIVSSKDKSEKYKVHLEWVDGEGWKPVKMDVLNTLETK